MYAFHHCFAYSVFQCLRVNIFLQTSNSAGTEDHAPRSAAPVQSQRLVWLLEELGVRAPQPLSERPQPWPIGPHARTVAACGKIQVSGDVLSLRAFNFAGHARKAHVCFITESTVHQRARCDEQSPEARVQQRPQVVIPAARHVPTVLTGLPTRIKNQVSTCKASIVFAFQIGTTRCSQFPHKQARRYLSLKLDTPPPCCDFSPGRLSQTELQVLYLPVRRNKRTTCLCGGVASIHRPPRRRSCICDNLATHFDWLDPRWVIRDEGSTSILRLRVQEVCVRCAWNRYAVEVGSSRSPKTNDNYQISETSTKSHAHAKQKKV